MPSARLVNAVACRTYAVLWTGFTVLYVGLGVATLWYGWTGLPPGMLNWLSVDPARLDPGEVSHALRTSSSHLLLFATLCAVLAVFTWRRSIIAVSISFVLWALAGYTLFAPRIGSGEYPTVAVAVIIAFALLLAAAIATRRHA